MHIVIIELLNAARKSYPAWAIFNFYLYANNRNARRLFDWLPERPVCVKKFLYTHQKLACIDFNRRLAFHETIKNRRIFLMHPEQKKRTSINFVCHQTVDQRPNDFIAIIFGMIINLWYICVQNRGHLCDYVMH